MHMRKWKCVSAVAAARTLMSDFPFFLESIIFKIASECTRESLGFV